jgi:geranylgeranyl diphosphate synthase type I
MKSPDAIAAYRPLVRAGVEAFIKRHQQLAAGGPAWRTDAIERLSGFAGAGKLLRGSLICYSYAICDNSPIGRDSGTPPPAAVLNTAVAIELIQAGLLIHDDIIDQDDLRRDQPAMHQQYRNLVTVQPLPGANRLGESLALCAGDMTLFLAFELLAEAQAEIANTPALTRLFVDELATVCAGQMEDIYLGALSAPPAKRDVYAVMRAKTAAYSVALPLAAGAVLANRPASLRQQLYAIGLAAGTIFQIKDDELGALGKSDDIGKPVGSDIREGKKTLLYYYLWQAVSRAERQKLTKIFGNPEAASSDIKYVQQSLRRHDIPARLQQDITKLEHTAFRQIDRTSLSQPAKNELRQLVRFCAARKL